MGYNRLRTMHDNTEAIRLAFKLRNERRGPGIEECLSLIHISEPTRRP